MTWKARYMNFIKLFKYGLFGLILACCTSETRAEIDDDSISSSVWWVKLCLDGPSLLQPNYPRLPYAPFTEPSYETLRSLLAAMKEFKWKTLYFPPIPSTYYATSAPLERYLIIESSLDNYLFSDRLIKETEQFDISLNILRDRVNNLQEILQIQKHLVHRVNVSPPDKKRAIWVNHYYPRNFSKWIASALTINTSETPSPLPWLPEEPEKPFDKNCLKGETDYLTGLKNAKIYVDGLAWKKPLLALVDVFSDTTPYKLIYPIGSFSLPKRPLGQVFSGFSPDLNQIFKEAYGEIYHQKITWEEFETDDYKNVENLLQNSVQTLNSLQKITNKALSQNPKKEIVKVITKQRNLLSRLTNPLEADSKSKKGQLELEGQKLKAKIEEIIVGINTAEKIIDDIEKDLASMTKSSKNIRLKLNSLWQKIRSDNDIILKISQQILNIRNTDYSALPADQRLLAMYRRNIVMTDLRNKLDGLRSKLKERREQERDLRSKSSVIRKEISAKNSSRSQEFQLLSSAKFGLRVSRDKHSKILATINDWNKKITKLIGINVLLAK